MGRLRAMRLGITKGVAHTAMKVTGLEAKLLLRYACRCGHTLAAHNRDRQGWEGCTDRKRILEAIGFYQPFNYCAVTHCMECERAEFGQDTRRGAHA